MSDLIERIEARFVSGNSVPVERAHITASEWKIIRDALEDDADGRNKVTPLVPEGWVITPLKHTKEMAYAGDKADEAMGDSLDFGVIYDAMIAARPA